MKCAGAMWCHAGQVETYTNFNKNEQEKADFHIFEILVTSAKCDSLTVRSSKTIAYILKREAVSV